MLRPLMFAASLLAAALLAAAPASFAGERIIEVWNPPEARQGAHLIGKTAKPPHHRKVLAHRGAPIARLRQDAQQAPQPASPRASQQAVHSPLNPSTPKGAGAAANRSAAPVTDASRFKHGETPQSKHDNDITHFEDIPRIVTPEGNVLRVGTDGATAEVAR
ncbi:hypothetical protein [Paraburkholderia rhizosphaerae]|uniref:Uncharacterized protein n=1 Tax=Paraburkholderia rhizosphaerae TaxID=480658 RepID=A0A4R8L3B8_9BURK|nr:hypothetical protein [Paraburkholderia rhizosphaerae]TDY37036.1 hypothetical protein BX592_14724 [Paraburkholderia rhizosphaerae]